MKTRSLPSNSHVSKAKSSPPSYTEGKIGVDNSNRTYTIGNSKLTASLVPLEHLKAHLRLLRAFKNLRTQVDNADNLPDATGILEASQRWAWFVTLAVERFQRWVAVVQDTPVATWIKTELPPVDVLMVWHTYMLNPGWYAEDCERLSILRILKGLGGRLLHAILEVEVGDLSGYEPSKQRKEAWLEQTGTPFDPLQAASTMDSHTVLCNKCHSTVNAPFLNDRGTGYAQLKFSVICSICGEVFNTERLGVAKFMRDITTSSDDSANTACAHSVYLAGTLYSQNNITDVVRAEQLKNTFIRAFPKSSEEMSKQEWEQDLLTRYSANMLRVREVCFSFFPSAQYGQPNHILTRVLSAYTDDRPFSIDLVGAVLRQGSFIDKMTELGWTNKCFEAPEDDNGLLHCLARYHAFLDLMATSPSTFLVPTLDIDLAWHTHQLMGDKYHHDCMRYVNRYIDHDDTVKYEQLVSSFDQTCLAWEERFKVPYMHCGCPLPDPTIGQRLHKVWNVLKTPMNALLPSSRTDVLLSTHASEHNMGAMDPHYRSLQVRKLQKRRWRDEERSRGGRMDPALLTRGVAHDYAFLAPDKKLHLKAGAPECIVGMTPLVHSTGSATGASSAPVSAKAAMIVPPQGPVSTTTLPKTLVRATPTRSKLATSQKPRAVRTTTSTIRGRRAGTTSWMASQNNNNLLAMSMFSNTSGGNVCQCGGGAGVTSSCGSGSGGGPSCGGGGSSCGGGGSCGGC